MAYNNRLIWTVTKQDATMGRKPDFPKQIIKLNAEITRLKKIIDINKKDHAKEIKKWQSTLEKEKISAYKAGCEDSLRAIEEEETAYMKFMKQAQSQFERMYHKKIKTKKKVT
jgi:hypothetical protein